MAALHLSNHELARKAIEERRLNHRSAMLPMESSGIIRGMLRVHNVTDAISMLNDELSLPFEVSLFQKDRIKTLICELSFCLEKSGLNSHFKQSNKKTFFVSSLNPMRRELL